MSAEPVDPEPQNRPFLAAMEELLKSKTSRNRKRFHEEFMRASFLLPMVKKSDAENERDCHPFLILEKDGVRSLPAFADDFFFMSWRESQPGQYETDPMTGEQLARFGAVIDEDDLCLNPGTSWEMHVPKKVLKRLGRIFERREEAARKAEPPAPNIEEKIQEYFNNPSHETWANIFEALLQAKFFLPFGDASLASQNSRISSMLTIKGIRILPVFTNTGDLEAWMARQGQVNFAYAAMKGLAFFQDFKSANAFDAIHLNAGGIFTGDITLDDAIGLAEGKIPPLPPRVIAEGQIVTCFAWRRGGAASQKLPDQREQAGDPESAAVPFEKQPRKITGHIAALFVLLIFFSAFELVVKSSHKGPDPNIGKIIQYYWNRSVNPSAQQAAITESPAWESSAPVKIENPVEALPTAAPSADTVIQAEIPPAEKFLDPSHSCKKKELKINGAQIEEICLD